ncbi:MAG: aldehyde ferredoxin oxidoreductase C-terminal domain-containing protein [Desulfosalsimonas sp.]
MLQKYYRLRGYDPNGVPRPETMKRLGIEPRHTGRDKDAEDIF